MSDLINTLNHVFGADNVVVIDGEDGPENAMTGFKLVPPKERNRFYPSIVNQHLWCLLMLENLFYNRLEKAWPDYAGGYFDFIEFPNGAKAPVLDITDDEMVPVQGEFNYYQGQMTKRALCVATFAVACNHLCFANQAGSGAKAVADNYTKLMDVLAEHEMFAGERNEIFAFLD